MCRSASLFTFAGRCIVHWMAEAVTCELCRRDVNVGNHRIAVIGDTCFHPLCGRRIEAHCELPGGKIFEVCTGGHRVSRVRKVTDPATCEITLDGNHERRNDRPMLTDEQEARALAISDQVCQLMETNVEYRLDITERPGADDLIEFWDEITRRLGLLGFDAQRNGSIVTVRKRTITTPE